MGVNYEPKLGYGFIVPENKEDEADTVVNKFEGMLTWMYTGNSILGKGCEVFVVCKYHEADDYRHTVVDTEILPKDKMALESAARDLGIECPDFHWFLGLHVG